MSGTLYGLLVLEGLVTLAGVALLLNRGYYDRRESDQLILDSTEHEMEKEQEASVVTSKPANGDGPGRCCSTSLGLDSASPF